MKLKDQIKFAILTGIDFIGLLQFDCFFNMFDEIN